MNRDFPPSIQLARQLLAQFERVLTVLKIRGSAHSDELLKEYEGISTGVAMRRGDSGGRAPGVLSAGGTESGTLQQEESASES